MKKSFLTIGLALLVGVAFASQKNDALKVAKFTTVSTFESISLELPFTGDANQNTICDVVFRKKGKSNWEQGLRLFNDYLSDQVGFRGSIVLLKPDTEYEIKLTYTDADGGSGEQQLLPKLGAKSSQKVKQPL